MAENYEPFSLLLKAGEAAPAIPARLWAGPPAPAPVLIDPHDRAALGKAVGQYLNDFVQKWPVGPSSQLRQAAEGLVYFLLNAFPQYNCVVVGQDSAYVARFHNYVAYDVGLPTLDLIALPPFDVFVLDQGSFALLAPGIQRILAFGGNLQGTSDRLLVFNSRRT